MTEVELVVNTFERTYREVLAPGAFDRLAGQHVHRFRCRTVLVNNVEDREDAQRLADARIAAGELDRVRFVEDHLDEALRRCGLRRDDLPHPRYFLDWALVAVCLDGPSHVLHWDADGRLQAPVDWVTPGLELLATDPRVLAVNPNWEAPTLARETLEDRGAFALGYGFSDQAFLVRRSDLARPVYADRTIAAWRYPYPGSFEARVDAHLRRADRRRATYRDAVYVHGTAMGTSWPDRSVRERAAAAGRDLTIRGLRRIPDPALPRRLRAL